MGNREKRSKKRSSSSRKRPENRIYLVDHSLGGKLIVEALAAVGVEAHRLVEILAEDSADTAVFAEVAKRGWVLLTRDKRIRRRPNERSAIVNSRIVVFLAPGGKSLTGLQVAEAIVKARHRMAQWLERYDPPFVARISVDGRLDIVELLDHPGAGR